MDINAQIIDQRVYKIETDNKEKLPKGDRAKGAAFVLLCVQQILEFSTDEALDCMTDGSQDCGIDAIHVGEIIDNSFVVNLFQGKYYKDLKTEKTFPSNEIIKIISSIKNIFNLSSEFQKNRKLAVANAEIQSLIRDGCIPLIMVYLCNNGKKWMQDGDDHIKMKV